MPLLFAITLFVSAFLLFLVQPMIAQMILPLLGGTPAVWNTCMVFFQAVLLAGYGYTHFATTHLPTKRQTLVQGCLLMLPFVMLILPIGIGAWTPATEVNPIFSVLYILLIAVGLPFFVVATSAPSFAALVFQHRPSVVERPLLPVRSQQLGQYAGAD